MPSIRSKPLKMFPERLHYCLLLTFVHFCLMAPSTAAAGKVPAIIAFGDSTADSGNNNNIPTPIKSNFPPYGRDFDGGVATGRFSNGRLVTDFISESFGLPPSVPAFLDKHRDIDQLAMGLSFASGGAGLDDLTTKVTSAISLSHQLDLFKLYKEKLKLAKGELSNEIITRALYYFSIGNNDLVDYFTLPVRSAQHSPPEYAAYLAGRASAAVREAYNHGARKFVFVSLLPVGCLPGRRAVNHAGPGKCNEKYNNLAMMFNAEIQEAMRKLNEELAGAQVVYAEMYSVVSAILANPSAYGYENSAQGCCGTGTVETAFLCGLDGALSCPDASKYVFFDSAHPTEKTYKIEATEMMKTALQVFM